MAENYSCLVKIHSKLTVATIPAKQKLRIFLSLLTVLSYWSLGEKKHLLAPSSFFFPYRCTHRIALEDMMFLISVFYQRYFTRKLFGMGQKHREKVLLVPLSESLPAFNNITLLGNTCVLIANANGASSSTYW